MRRVDREAVEDDGLRAHLEDAADDGLLAEAEHVTACLIDDGLVEDFEAVRRDLQGAVEGDRVEGAAELLEAALFEAPADVSARVDAEIAEQRMELEALDRDRTGRERHSLRERLELAVADADVAVGPGRVDVVEADGARGGRLDVERDRRREDLAVEARSIGRDVGPRDRQLAHAVPLAVGVDRHRAGEVGQEREAMRERDGRDEVGAAARGHDSAALPNADAAESDLEGAPVAVDEVTAGRGAGIGIEIDRALRQEAPHEHAALLVTDARVEAADDVLVDGVLARSRSRAPWWTLVTAVVPARMPTS